jgi:tetratricopeptide (TPR) repeat protein
VIVELEQSDYERAGELFQGLDFHLAVAAILGGSVSGRVFVDNVSNPQAGLLFADTVYPVFTAWFDEADNLAINGNASLREGRYEEALDWFERAFALGEDHDWAYWSAARATITLDQDEAALHYLEQAVEHGFRELALLLGSEHFKRLYGSRGWAELIDRLETRIRLGALCGLRQ